MVGDPEVAEETDMKAAVLGDGVETKEEDVIDDRQVIGIPLLPLGCRYR